MRAAYAPAPSPMRDCCARGPAMVKPPASRRGSTRHFASRILPYLDDRTSGDGRRETERNCHRCCHEPSEELASLHQWSLHDLNLSCATRIDFLHSRDSLCGAIEPDQIPHVFRRNHGGLCALGDRDRAQQRERRAAWLKDLSVRRLSPFAVCVTDAMRSGFSFMWLPSGRLARQCADREIAGHEQMRKLQAQNQAKHREQCGQNEGRTRQRGNIE